MTYLDECGQIPYLSKEDIIREVEDLLVECWDGSFPVDVEAICDYCGISIVPVVGLANSCAIDAFVSADFKTIYVDEWGYRNEGHRYRFSLAHELGHFILHKEYFSSRVDSFEEWRGLSHAITNNYVEFQANSFAGCLLAPEGELTRALDTEFKGSFARNYWCTSYKEIERSLANVRRLFGVSGQVIDRRMRDAYFGLR